MRNSPKQAADVRPAPDNRHFAIGAWGQEGTCRSAVATDALYHSRPSPPQQCSWSDQGTELPNLRQQFPRAAELALPTITARRMRGVISIKPRVGRFLFNQNRDRLRAKPPRSIMRPRDELSDGILNMPREMSAREHRADSIRFYLLVCGRILVLPAAVLGFDLLGLLGCAIGAGVSWIIGMWVRRSLGVRG